MDNSKNPGMIDMQVLIQREKERQEKIRKLLRKWKNMGVKLEKDDEYDAVWLRKLIRESIKILRDE